MTATWPDSERPRLVLLAAGASSRLGTPKALAPLPKGTPLQRLLEAWPTSNPLPTVVTGAHHLEIVEHLKGIDRPTSIIHNKDWASGRTGSLQAAVACYPDQDLVVAPVDCPRVPGAVFEALLESWLAQGRPAMGWCAPYVLGPDTGKKMHGHPILIGRGLLKELQQMHPDQPLRILRGSAQPAFGVRVSHFEILEDLDTPEDLKKLMEQDRQST